MERWMDLYKEIEKINIQVKLYNETELIKEYDYVLRKDFAAREVIACFRECTGSGYDLFPLIAQAITEKRIKAGTMSCNGKASISNNSNCDGKIEYVISPIYK